MGDEPGLHYSIGGSYRVQPPNLESHTLCKWADSQYSGPCWGGGGGLLLHGGPEYLGYPKTTKILRDDPNTYPLRFGLHILIDVIGPSFEIFEVPTSLR